MNVSLRVTLMTLVFVAVMVFGMVVPAVAASAKVAPRPVAAAHYFYPEGGSGITPIRRWKC